MQDFLSSKNNKAYDENSEILLAFPIEEDVEWQTDDKTTIQMKLGYDRFYNTNLPFKLNNKIVSTNETISLNGEK